MARLKPWAPVRDRAQTRIKKSIAGNNPEVAMKSVG
jgi:hypothetical protein